MNHVQKVIGKPLCCACAVDSTVLHAVNDVATSASKGTEATLKATTHLLNHAPTRPDAEVIHGASDMILRVDSDTADLVASKARSGAGGCHGLSCNDGSPFNGPALVLAKVIKNVMALAAEAKIGALFVNAQEAAGLQNCLRAMGFPQLATMMKTDDMTANGIINNAMKQKQSKAIDMRFHWTRDQTRQGQFHICWESGKNDMGDCHAEHHPASHHRLVKPIHTHVEGKSPTQLQGCVEMMNGKQFEGQP